MLGFDLQTMSGCSIEFRVDAAGRVSELVSHQPNGSFVGKKRP